MALKVAHHPRLLAALVEHFLPRRRLGPSQPAADTPSLYGRPVWRALKAIRLLAAWGRGVASHLADKFDLGPTLLAYIALDPSDSAQAPPSQESLRYNIPGLTFFRFLRGILGTVGGHIYGAVDELYVLFKITFWVGIIA